MQHALPGGRMVSWPRLGDRTAFRRRVAVLTSAGAACILALVAAVWALQPHSLAASLPLAGGALVLVLLGTHGAARTVARRREIERSFAGLAVTHLGRAYRVAGGPVLGEYPSRRHAARAAMDRGGWAVIVRAWDRFYVLSAVPTAQDDPSRTPVSFRSRAVADVVPALRDDVALGA